MNVKEIFSKADGGTLTYEQFTTLCSEAGAKFTDLSEGKYVSKSKYDSDIATKDTEISTLNDTISTRDTDLADLKTKLENAGADTDKLASLSSDLTNLQTKYDADTKSLQDRLSHQAYEFAVKEFANTKQFTSNAAKRDFINSMLNKNLTMENDKILGADDFVTAYSTDNEDAFVIEKDPEPEPQPAPTPHFVNPTPGVEPKQDNAFHFNFTGVRPHND